MRLVKSWEEATTANCGFGAEQGKAPVDIVWRHAFRAEAAQARGGAFGCILWDLLKCYEKVSHALLISAAVRHGYPLAVLRLCIFSYRSPRRIIFNHICSRPIIPQCGILAGCSTATSELRLLLLDSARNHRRSHPTVNLSIYIDDLALDTSSSSARVVVDALSAAALDLSFDLEQKALLPIAKAKTAVLANSCATARAIRSNLGELGGPCMGTVRSLGSDFWAANPLRRNSRPVRALRKATLATKITRLKALKAADRRTASRVFFCGAIPSVHFDTQIYGLFGSQLAVARRLAGSFLSLTGKRKSRNLSMAFAPDKDPEICCSTPVLRRYCNEVWNASLPPTPRPIWRSPGGNCWGVGSYSEHNSNPPFCFKGGVNGPISALHRTLHKAGWVFTGPLFLITKAGRALHLPTVCPARVAKLFAFDLKQTIIHRDITRLHVRSHTDNARNLFEHGLFFQPLLNMYKRLDSFSASMLQNIVCNGIFTNTDLLSLGYDVSPDCPSCGLAHDTIFHRCYSCPAIEQRAVLALGQPLFDKIIAEGSDSLLANRCLLPTPCFSSRPSQHTIIKYINFGPGSTFHPDQGRIFGDGSCLSPHKGPLARAGFACVQVCEAGDILKAVYGCLPASLPQSSQAAEFAALGCAFDCSEGAAYVGDCSNVIASVHLGATRAVAAMNPSACTWRLALHRYGNTLPDRAPTASKVKAHRKLEDVGMDPTRIREFYGNFHADAFARKDALLHDDNKSDILAYAAAKKDLENLAHHMIDTLSALHSSRLLNVLKAPRLTKAARTSLSGLSTKAVHNFTWQGKMWICTRCLLRSSSPLLSFSHKPCTGHDSWAELLHNSTNGHVLWAADVASGGRIVYCINCWSYASAFPRNLLLPCQIPLRGRPCSQSHVSNRRHLVSRSRLLRLRRLHV